MTPEPDVTDVDASRDRTRRLASAIALATSLIAGVAVFAIATQLFPYHSSNDDEAVYLLQAAMLLEGQLELRAGELADAFRPWFFVDDGGRLYPKYAPVPAAMYAVSMALFGEPRVTLAAVAAGNAFLTYVLGSRVADRRVGLVAAAVFTASPMTLLTSSVFLPYAPTTLLNMLFAVCYLRAVGEDHLPSAAAAGVAIGLAFFARPYTAVLFAAPFVCHAAWTTFAALRDRFRGPCRPDRRRGLRPIPGPVRRNALTAAIGLAFVALTLAYNARLTGSPLRFPYEAFAPLDGVGFGRRRILGHEIEYTPELAIRANGYALWYLATRWFTAGPLGSALALAGLALALRRWLPAGRRASNETPLEGGRTAGLLLAATLVTVPLGNVAFWGNYNVLGGMDDPTTGLVSQFGPFYHFDALAPLSIFAAIALVAGWRRVRSATARRDGSGARAAPAVGRREERTTSRRATLAAAGSVGASALVLGGVDAALLRAPVQRNAAHTERFAAAYEPFEEASLENALVFLPTPYGGWQGHPFQALRNDPDLDGEVVYALDGDPERDFAVLGAYPERDAYRYAYRGEWAPAATLGDSLTSTLEPLSVRQGAPLAGETVVGVPALVERATVRVETDAGRDEYAVDEPGDRIVVDWTIDGERATVAEDGGDDGDGPDDRDESTDESTTAASVPLDDVGEVVVSVTLVDFDGGTFTYRQETTVRPAGDGVEAVWPPERRGCPLGTDCGSEGTYLADRPEAHPDWMVFETRLDG